MVAFAVFVGCAMVYDMTRLYREQRGELIRLQGEKENYLKWTMHNLRIPLAAAAAKISRIAEMTGEEIQSGMVSRNIAFDDLNRAMQTMLAQTVNETERLRAPLSDELFDHSPLIDISEFVQRKMEMYERAYNAFADPVIVPGLYVRFDPAALNGVVDNLISNAVEAQKRTGSEKSIEIRLSSGRGGKIRLSVTDHGPGLTEDQKQDLLKSQGFSRSAGIPFVRAAVSSAGGTFAFEDPEGHAGLKTVVALPEAKPAGWDEPVGEFGVEPPKLLEIVPAEAEPVNESDKPLVMVIDDNPGIRDYIGLELRDRFRVAGYPSPEEALEALGIKMNPYQKDGSIIFSEEAETVPDLIITDNYFGSVSKISGIRLVDRLIDSPYVRTPVLLISQYLAEETAGLLAAPGMLEFLRKPVNPQELRARVGWMVAQSRDFAKFAREMENEDDVKRMREILRDYQSKWELRLEKRALID